MTMHIDDMLHVLTAYKNGKTIQFKNTYTAGEWFDRSDSLLWDFTNNEYRVKPEPREFWINQYVGAPNRYYTTPEAAREGRTNGYGDEYGYAIHVREVLE